MLLELERKKRRSPNKNKLQSINSQPNELESIEAGLSKHQTEQFESLEPTRTAKQVKRSAEAKQSISSQKSVSFDRKVQELSAKYGKPSESEPSMLVRLHAAAIKIQFAV